MKLITAETASQILPVAPFAGAWIETLFLVDEKRVSRVAPFAGAWIETDRW